VARWDSLLWHIQKRVGGWVCTYTVKDEHTYNTIQKMGSINKIYAFIQQGQNY